MNSLEYGFNRLYMRKATDPDFQLAAIQRIEKRQDDADAADADAAEVLLAEVVQKEADVHLAEVPSAEAPAASKTGKK